jgi:predicted nucleic acid-binding protein
MRPTLPSGRRRTGHGGGPGPARLFVDSGAWIALLSRRDQHHAEADQLFRDAVTRQVPLLTTNLILAEVHRLVLFRLGVRPAEVALERIEASAHVGLHFASPEDHGTARAWLKRLAPHPITYTDAVSFAVMDRVRCGHALAFDHDFEVAGFTLWRRS